MNDDQFDLDDDLLEEQEKSSLKTRVVTLWQENPVFKVGVIVIGIIVLYIGYSAAFGTNDQEDVYSRTGQARNVTSVPGEEDLDPTFREAVEETNIQRAEEAKRLGTSALPTPIGSTDSRIEVPDVDVSESENPLDVWRRRSEAVNIESPEDESAEDENFEQIAPELSLAPHTQMQPRMPQQGAGGTAQPDTTEMTTRFAEQMRVILGTKQPPSPSLISSNYPSPYEQYLEQRAAMEQARSQGGDPAQQGSAPGADNAEGAPYMEDGTAESEGEVLLPAGTVVYAQILNALNSDMEGPVLAHILSGPFAGSRAIGQFQRENDHLVITFERIVQEDDVYTAQAYALDADTTLTGVRSDVDRHWVRRVVLPAAAEFIAGMGAAIAESNQTTVTVDQGAGISETEEPDARQEVARGVEQSADKVSDILDDESDVEITVTLDKGTPIGMLFTESIKEGDRQ